ncbi:biotin--[acetyl-CoA-carboxylase] ligase [Alkanindiges sp. WGS2144]|uniref:biotin--[acetyl-CoA-carboxylase] ligase n=1 Tax=Alkanindiges sp. WGS2144 TaxID=3366808 RepID=UPI003751FA5C
MAIMQQRPPHSTLEPETDSLIEQDVRVHALKAALKYQMMSQQEVSPHDTPHRSTIYQDVQQLNPVYWLNSTTSTNDAARTIDSPAALVLSNHQQAGRGQAGRIWHSPEGNLYLSLLWTLGQPVSGRLALEVALSLLNMPLLSQCPDLQVKWPNDLYFKGAKWGGILIEPCSEQRVVIGVGLNLKPMQALVTDQCVSDLSTMTGHTLDQVELAIQVTLALLQACQHFEQGSPYLPDRFARFDALLNQQVIIHQPALADIEGAARGIQTDGALLLDTASGQKIIYSGQVRPVI